jgi:hypothetical protein
MFATARLILVVERAWTTWRDMAIDHYLQQFGLTVVRSNEKSQITYRFALETRKYLDDTTAQSPRGGWFGCKKALEVRVFLSS